MSTSYFRGARNQFSRVSRRRPLPGCFRYQGQGNTSTGHCFSTKSKVSDPPFNNGTGTHTGTGIHSVYDKSPDWRDWFQSAEYVNAWSDDIEPLDDAPVVDGQSRMVLDLLNKLFQVGLTKTVDRVTTERVHAVLQQLADLPQQTTNSMWQRAERGRALLEAMEQFEELRDEPSLPLSLPIPTHETYWRVLRMYSSKYLHGTKDKHGKDVPEICRAIVQRMQDSGHLELQPTVIHWNQVLSAYANSRSETRPLDAAKLLYELDSKGMTDASSFSHALRACSALSARHQTVTPKFVEIAIPVAQRIWSGLKQSDSIDIQPYHFTHILRVFRNIPDVAKRDEAAYKVFSEAIQARKVNIHVLNELLQVASQDVIARLLGTPNYPTEAESLIRLVPSEWIEDVGEDGKSPFEWE